MKRNILTLAFYMALSLANAQNEFITTWKTDNPGVSNDDQITIPTYPLETYNYTIEWGDGTSDSGVTGNITHSYATSGNYMVAISGTFPRIYFNDEGDEEKLIAINQWGNNAWSDMSLAFSGCRRLKIEATDVPDLSNVTSLYNMFYRAGEYPFSIPRIDEWDVSGVTNLSGMFDKTSFNQDISAWDVSNVIHMARLFFSSQFNQDISNWDVSNVIDMGNMFASSQIDQDLSNWDVSNVERMSYMFSTTHCNYDLSSWDVSNVKEMWGMFSSSQFDHDISGWNISNVLNMNFMFDNSDFSDENYNKLLIAWSELPSIQNGVELGANDAQYCLGETARQSLITNYGWSIQDYGKNCSEPAAFVTTWKTDNPGFSADNQIEIPTHPRENYDYNVDWGDGSSDTNVTGNIRHTYNTPGTYTVSITGKFPRIYFNADEIREELNLGSDDDKIISIDQWGTNRWLSMGFAFAGCENLDMKATDIPDFTRGLPTNGMFLACTKLNGNSTMNSWDLSLTNHASYMFQDATLFNQPLNNWDTSAMLWIDGMFRGATNFNQDLGDWNLGQVQLMASIFDDTGISTKNYDKTLTGWSQVSSFQNGVVFGANILQYCESEVVRQNFIDAFGWTINDAGKDPNCNLDNDNDGVLDHIDQCLDTLTGSLVSADGCLELSANNFSVEGIDETCPDTNNAQIKIAAVLAYDFVATIDGNNYTFNDELLIENLAPGTYDLCITYTAQSFEQCFILELGESANISGKSSIVNGKVAIEINQGTAPYSAMVNGKPVLQTSSKTFFLDAEEGDSVEIFTDKICEGSFVKTIKTGSVVAFPNPTSGSFEIALPIIQTEVAIELFTIHSQLISTKMYPVIGGRASVDIEDLPNGVYVVNVHFANPRMFKIVKQ